MIDASTAPFSLPLTRPQFEAALRTGHGRALMHAQRCGLAGLEDALLYACRNNLVYDKQCEDSRGEWLVRIATTGGVAELISATLSAEAAPATPSDDAWTAEQRSEILGSFARAGDQRARTALYRTFSKAHDWDKWIGDDEIIKTDGVEGLRYVARTFGAHLKQHGGDPPYVYGLDDLPGHSRGDARRLLLEMATSDPDIAFYVERATATDTLPLPSDHKPPRRDSHTPRPYLSVAEAIAEIENEKRRDGRLRQFARSATDTEIDIVARRFRSDFTQIQIQRFLHVFQSRSWPPLIPVFLSLTDHTDRWIRTLAWRSAGNCPDERVRVAMYSALAAVPIPVEAFESLSANLRDDDISLLDSNIDRLLAQTSDPVARHSMYSDVIGAFEDCPAVRAVSPLFSAYEFDPCTQCRATAIEQLLARAPLPAWLREECQFDATERIRELLKSSDGSNT